MGARWDVEVSSSRLRRVWSHRARVAEAMVLLAAASAAQKWVPMTKWSAVLGAHGHVPPRWRGKTLEALPISPDSRLEVFVTRAVRSGAAHLPWEPSCLAEATAGQVMLRRRGHAGVVVIGLRHPTDSTSGPWDAHAWLLGRQGALTGGPAAAGFTATTVFEVPGALQAEQIAVT